MEASTALGRYLRLQLGDTIHVFENTVFNGSVIHLFTVLKREHLSSPTKKPLFFVVFNGERAAEEVSNGIVGGIPVSYFNIFPPEWEVNKDSTIFKKLTYITNILYINHLIL